MNQISSDLYATIINLLTKQIILNKDVYLLKNRFINSDWEVKTKDEIVDDDGDFKDKSITFSKQTLFDSLFITFSDKIHIFFYHKNDSKDPYIVTNAYVFGENLDLTNLHKLKRCLTLVQ